MLITMDYIVKDFAKHKWTHISQTPKHMIFEKNDREFSIQKNNNRIMISTPLKESPFNYEKTFKNVAFDEVYEYILDKLNYLDEEYTHTRTHTHTHTH